VKRHLSKLEKDGFIPVRAGDDEGYTQVHFWFVLVVCMATYLNIGVLS
jgi:hypothetical protein